MSRAAALILLACGLVGLAAPASGRGLFAAADAAYPSPFPLFGAPKLTAEQASACGHRGRRNWAATTAAAAATARRSSTRTTHLFSCQMACCG